LIDPLIYVFPTIGSECVGLPEDGAKGDASRCEAVKHSAEPKRLGQDVWLWHQRSAGQLSREDSSWIAELHGGQYASTTLWIYLFIM